MQSGYTELNSYRYERKFIATKYTRLQTENIIKQNNAFFVSVYHPRWVNNIYFDTPGLDCYFDNLFGNARRWKARIRWYGEVFGLIEKPILEFKIKKGFVGTKKSFRLPAFQVNKTEFDGRDVMNVFEKAELPDNIKEKLKGVLPVLLNTYQRSYFTNLQKNFRITVDDQLNYYNLRPTWNKFQFKHTEELKNVVELKYDQEWDRDAGIISNQFPFRLNKNSKFVAGMSHFRSEIAD